MFDDASVFFRPNWLLDRATVIRQLLKNKKIAICVATLNVKRKYKRKMINHLLTTWRRGGSVVSASDLGPEGRELEPWPVHPRCVLRQNT